MQSPHGLLKPSKKMSLGKTVAGFALAGSCAALFGFAMVGSSESLGWGASPAKAPSFDYISYFDDGTAALKGRDSSVRRLGVSAVFETAATDELALSGLAGKIEPAEAGASEPTRHAAVDVTLDPARDPHLQPENVSVGDRITVVAPDGLSYVYRVTASEALNKGEAKAAIEKTELDQPATADCKALGSLAAGAFRLVIESVKVENGHHTPGEQKL